MKYVGYHRTSTEEQKLDRGINEITKYCDTNGIKLHRNKVYTDQQTGKNFNRPSYQLLRQEVLEEGDVLIITEVDRLGRNKEDTLKELRYFKDNHIRVMILELPTTLVDMNSMGNDMAKMMMETINNMLIELYASLAEGEMHKRVKRQREGYEALRASGKWDEVMGRPRALAKDIFEKDYKLVLEGKLRPCELMRKHNLSRATYYRYRDDYQKENNSSKEVKPEVNADVDDELISF
jgi:DNA invertase Pin-like site-specific DNA recombinase